MNEGQSNFRLLPEGQPLEEQLRQCTPAGAPAKLREAVMYPVGCELRAARWDRRMGRMAGALLVAGIGMSTIAFRLYPLTPNGPVNQPTPQAIGQLAASVAEATDLTTAKEFALRMAALQGWSPQSKEMAIIQQSALHLQSHKPAHGEDG